MTISYWAWDCIEQRFREFILPNALDEDVHVPLPLESKEGIGLVCNDILAAMRNTAVSHWIDPKDGRLKHISCRTFFMRVFKHAFDTLQQTGVQKYIICIDPPNNPRIEKTATRLKRKKKTTLGVPDTLTMPERQSRFFMASADMPGPLDLIFQTPQAKAELYEFITEFLGFSEISSMIPPGKWLILSGGGVRLPRATPEERITDFHNDMIISLPPIRYTCDKEPELLSNLEFPGLSEGDIDVWRWVDYFPDDSFHVHSNDGDVFLIGLMQMRKIIRINPKRQGWFITRRSLGSSEPSPERVEKKEKLKTHQRKIYDQRFLETQSIDEAFRASGGVVGEIMSSMAASSSSSSPFSTKVISFNDDDDEEEREGMDSFPSSSSSSISRKRPRKAPVFTDRYVNMFGIYNGFVQEVHELMEHCKVDMQNPVELYVLGLCLSSESHDYIQTKLLSRGVGSQYIWNAFKKNISHFHDLVLVFKPRSGHAIAQMNLRHYFINTEKLSHLVECIYKEKSYHTISMSKSNNTQLKLDRAREKSATKNREKNGPSPMEIQVVAAQCVWLLQYWGNGIHADYNIIDGTVVDEETGLSLYGFTPSGWATSVIDSKYKVAPPV